MPHRTIRTPMLLSAGLAAAAGVLACGQDSGEGANGDGEAQDIAGAAEAADGVHSSARHDFRVVTVADGLDHPWSMAWLPGGEMLIVERPGRLRVVRDGVLQPEPVAGWPEVYRDEGQGGFMDILPHPDFAENRWLYLSYGKPNEDGSEGTTTVVRGRWDDGRVTDVEEVFESNAWHDNNNHFSGRMAFGLDGYLYLTVGDRMFDPDMMADHPALDVTNHMGTIVRLHDDGRVPGDNPFVGRSDGLPEIWSYGHRNLQGLAVDPGTGEVWSNEHGPRGGDELNLISGGGNYGWPVVSHGINYDGTVYTTDASGEGAESPRFVWTPSIGISGMMIYRGDAFPWWKGSAFVGGMVGEQLGRVILEGTDALGVETLLPGELGRIRDVREGPDGLIYLALEHAEDLTAVVRLEPVASDVMPPE
ncbi:MAG: PQQ-dependent sugar dehydrogenase [Gammaproteobacteria bacterium]|nr:PQQ-dependent sugar dehydrogenase [Gammaproteobacteria bacterium]MDE0649963.1 PQQ-dependent sugar dehydrogenase [Gammaproteobacteria bacterium]